jgi:methylmalonyl-CoA mutase C-terminal domain/subunit
MKRIRVLIGMMGLDQHEVGAITVSSLLRDAGMEVIYVGTFNRPDTIVRQSIQEDVDVIGLSCHSWEYLYTVPELLRLLRQEGLALPVVVGGSVITPDDRSALLELGVSEAFGPESGSAEIVEGIRSLVGDSVDS